MQNSPLGDLSVAEFLEHYWQKKPLLIRQAFPGYECPVEPAEVAGLACEADVQSRLVLEKDGAKPWQLEHGPFPEERFASLPATHWTVLIQEINKHVPEFALLQESFNFIPNWRLDDVMVSYAPPHGSVGPHADNYDVFLLQGHGRRHWKINTTPPGTTDLIEGADLRIMKHWETEQEWVLEPGDLLYLPPGVAHYGVALDDCITISVGFRAPTFRQMTASYLDEMIDQIDEEAFYGDPELAPQANPGELHETARARIREFLRSLVEDDLEIDRWFGRFITEARREQEVPQPDEPLTADAFLGQLEACGELWRSEYCRYSYFIDEVGAAFLYTDGFERVLAPELAFAAPLLCNQRVLTAEELAPYLGNPTYIALLTELCNDGALYFPNEE